MSENKIATKADLQRMYNKILPYLGGMPEMVANKFSKGDLYSTEERMIGQWIDGKPLYQKTYTNISISNEAANVVDSSFGTNNKLISFCVDFTGKDDTTNDKTRFGSTLSDTLYIDGGSLLYYFSRSGTWWPVLNTANITIQYTKTTDSPISIGSDTDYSTEEKIVGTWIDGKPLYQKTWTNITLASGDVNVISLGNNISQILSAQGFAYKPDSVQYISIPAASPNANYTIEIWTYNLSELHLVAGTNRAGYIATVTIQYTKTTD